MPGPVSDSYDPEFGTGENANTVREAIQETADYASAPLSRELKYIVTVAESHDDRRLYTLQFTEREIRIIRFCMNRALETI